MANIITAGNSTNGGTSVVTDTSGTLDIKTGSGSGAIAISIDTSQSTTLNSAASTAPFIAKINGAESARIDSVGNLLVGTSTTTTGAKISVTNGTQGFQIGSSIGPSNVFSGYLTMGGSNGLALQTSATSAIGQLGFYNPNGQVGSVATNGSGTSFVTTSDYRLKENISPMTGALATVAQLNPVTYTWKVDGSDGQGFIAHELQAVVPDCVTGEKDAVDAEGNPVYQGIDTSFLVATLTAAIQELKAELDALKAKVGE